jgi:hypothetical protein
MPGNRREKTLDFPRKLLVCRPREDGSVLEKRKKSSGRGFLRTPEDTSRLRKNSFSAPNCHSRGSGNPEILEKIGFLLSQE